MEMDLWATSGAVVGKSALPDEIFGIEPNEAVVHQAMVAHLANQRQGTADTKTRSEVAGGGRKMWRQKGTGHARQGSRRAPHWKGGGVVFGPHPRSYRLRLPKKMRRLALCSALSAKVASGAVRMVDELEIADGRTKSLLAVLDALQLDGKILIVLAEHDPMVRRAASNLGNVFIAVPNGVSLLDVLNAEIVVITPPAAAELARRFGPEAKADEDAASGEAA